MDRAALLGKIVLGIEIQQQGYGRRRTALNEECLGKLGVALGFRLALGRCQGGIEVEESTESGIGLNESGGTQIQRAGREFCIHGRQSGVRGIKGPRISVQLEFAASRKIGRNRDREFSTG